MATINGLTAAAMRAIRDGAIVGASVDISGHLILEKFDGTSIDTGSVVGPVGPMGPAGPVPEAPSEGTYWVRRNGAWVAVPVGEAPADGKYYSRRNGAWSVSDAILGSSALIASITPFENTNASTWADLATIGPVVNATIGASGRALVSVACWLFSDIKAAPVSMSFQVTGVSSRAPQDSEAVLTFDDEISASRVSIVTGLNPGVNTFTAKYKSLGGNAGFGYRSLIVIPL